MPKITIPLTRSFLRPGGGSLGERLAGLRTVLAVVLTTLRDPRRDLANDPIRRARTTLLSDPVRLQEMENQVEQEIGDLFASALAEVRS